MKEVTLLEFRRSAQRVLRRIQRGERVVLTYRGRPVARLEPIRTRSPSPDDPIYRLASLARKGGRTMSNREIDRVLYGL